jgi:uncharacterized protein (DUF1501 family)
MESAGDTLVVVFLRGAMDGLNAVIPLGEAEYYRKRTKNFLFEAEAGRYRGHESLECLGRTSIRKSLFSGLQRRRYMRIRVWRCEQMDKIYVFRLTSTQENDDRFDRFCDQVVCH